MHQALQAELVSLAPNTEHPTGDVVLVEPNGDRHTIRCTARPDGTTLEGDGEMLDYLNERYGDRTVCFTARDAVLDAAKGQVEPGP